ncbi:MAG: prepilin-type N-terminal cleavage/methylation domain-containing protein [Candidatus Omnitrophica bacterium]|nr:prepilin-type N-terminal cleavage/methylation domain-containing protein [Candidatus Omnitrophota bacterium]
MEDNKNKGFTLLEVLISLAIIALALTVILKAQFYNLKLCAESKNILIAKILAQEKMAEVELTEELEVGEGIFPENKDFSWALGSNEVEENLKEVNLTITWKEGNLTKDFCITTYLLQD